MDVFSDHDLSRYGTYRIGGFADFFIEAKSETELIEALEWAVERDLPYFVFGAGSNLLFDDAGFRGLVIQVKMNQFRVEGERIEAEAGVLSSKIVEAAAAHNLTGLEAWKGLPGTVGGAVYGNAGCFGVETKDILESARLWLPGEGVQEHPVAWFDYDYRDSKLKRIPGAVVLSARFRLKSGNAPAIVTQMSEIQNLRIQKQPPGLSTGSFFKNPPGDRSAGQLIDAAGLKGFQLGPMKVSEFHANFFMNTGGATSADVNALAEHVQEVVKEKFGIELEREVIAVPRF